MAHPGENPGYTRPDAPVTGGKGVAPWDLRVNPMKDTRLDSFPSLQQDGYEKFLYRGYMKTALQQNGGALPTEKGQTQYWLLFRYNPSSIAVQHSLSASNVVLPAGYRPPEDSSNAIGMTGGSLSFELLFDRTYETSDMQNNGDNESLWTRDLGVLSDAHVLYNMVGMNDPAQSGSPDNTTRNDNEPQTVLGVMQMSYVWVHFMNPRTTSIYNQLPPHSRLNYFGYITNIGITYSHFTQRMAPTRAAFSISLNLMTSTGFFG